MKKRIPAFLMVLLLLMLTACSASKTITIGTGNEGGNYYTYGTKIADLGKGSDNYHVRTTAGSAANVRLIRDGFLDVAIVQSDVLNDAYFGTGTFEDFGPCRGYSAIAGLYTETCQIVVRADSPIQSVADLQGKKVSVGEAESGTLQNTTQILSVAGLKLSDVDAQYLSFTDSAKALKDGEIDAFFCTALVMMHVTEELSSDTQIRLIPLDADLIARLMSNYSGYTQTVVPAGTYNGQDKDVPTVGVKAVLIARDDLPEEKAESLLNLVFENAEQFKEECKLSSAVTPEFATSDITVPFHKGTAKFYNSHNITVNTATMDSSGTPIAGQDD